MKTAYKVVRIANVGVSRKLRSITVDSAYIVDYRWNKWNKPRTTGNPFLFVFSELHFAQKFIENNLNPHHIRIYEVKVKNLSKNALTRGGVPRTTEEFPSGTSFADEVKFIKRIK